MRTGVTIEVSSEARRRLEALVRDRSAAQKQVWRDYIVLLLDDGLGTNANIRQTGKSKVCVWRWQERFAEGGATGSCGTRPDPRAYHSSTGRSPTGWSS